MFSQMISKQCTQGYVLLSKICEDTQSFESYLGTDWKYVPLICPKFLYINSIQCDILLISRGL